MASAPGRREITINHAAASRSGWGWHLLVLPLLLPENSNAKLHSEQESFHLPWENYVSVPALYSQEGQLWSAASPRAPESTRAGSWEETSLKGRESQWVSSSSSVVRLLFFFPKGKKKKKATKPTKTKTALSVKIFVCFCFKKIIKKIMNLNFKSVMKKTNTKVQKTNFVSLFYYWAQHSTTSYTYKPQ